MKDDHAPRCVKPTGAKVQRQENGKVTLSATYPDGGHWQSLFDDHFQSSPKDNLWLIDDHR